MAAAESSMNERAAASSVTSTSCTWTRAVDALGERLEPVAPARAGADRRALAHQGLHRCLADSRRGTGDDRLLSLQGAGHGYGPGVAGSTAASAATSSASRIAAPSSALDSART